MNKETSTKVDKFHSDLQHIENQLEWNKDLTLWQAAYLRWVADEIEDEIQKILSSNQIH